MRLLVGSDGPASIGQQADIRAWTQRLLWFAEEGDAIVMMDAPDPVFVEHVTTLTGVDPSTLRFHIMPSRWTGGNFDAWSLLDPAFQDALAADADAATDIMALWPCAEIGWLVKSFKIEHKLHGAAFWREGGGVLANSKALFRAFAAGSGVSTPLGGVCLTPEDAFRLSGHLLQQSHGFMVKRSYGGAGAGNEVVCAKRLSVSHAGYASIETIEGTPAGLHDYWARRWQWASSNGTFPVVIEEFIPDARTLYAEVFCDDAGAGACKIGELKFAEGKIVREVFPAQDVPIAVNSELECAAHRLAQAYQAVGYRGFLSLDSIVTPDRRVLFTEANARFTSSTHLYKQIAEKVARIAQGSERVVIQTSSPASWKLQSLDEFLAILSRNQLAFDPETRKGVLAVTPLIEHSGHLSLATVAESEMAAIEIVQSMHAIVKSDVNRKSS